MGSVIGRRAGPRLGETDPTLAARTPVKYREMEIRSRRLDKDSVELSVRHSPVPSSRKGYVVTANQRDLQTLDVPLQATIEHGAEVGRMLAEVLLIEPVYAVLQQSLRALDAKTGLRLRLALDPSLIDLPWELMFRPDLRTNAELPGFLSLDPKLSLVRGQAGQKTKLAPSADPQRLLFLGTYWRGGEDRWGVEDEFGKLSFATRPIGDFLSMDFVDVMDSQTVNQELERGASIVHYAGHSDRDDRGYYLVREANDYVRRPRVRAVTNNRGDLFPWYAPEVSAALADARTRLVVFSACNAGAWGLVEPLLSSVPAVVGMYGQIASDSAVQFCDKLYAALAVGLTLDEATTYARANVARHGVLPLDWAHPMVYLSTREAVLFPRRRTRSVRQRQSAVRDDGTGIIEEIRRQVLALGHRGGVGLFISDLAAHQVLILGNFKPERKAVLDALRQKLRELDADYLPCVFDFDVPKGRRLGESVLSLAGLSRFVIADLTDPVSVPAELEKIIKEYRSVLVQPVLLHGRKPYALFEDHVGAPNVLDIVYYTDVDDLMDKLETEIIPTVEAKLGGLRDRPGGT